ncbi:MAG: hypothetical protein M1383_00970 [Patescibacteria group bacterium]|nr:hypothetical protein [Patescibacteria group bacterium]
MVIYTIVLSLFLIFSLVVLFVITSAFLGFLLTRVPFVPTHASDIEFIVKKLGISSRDIFYDLGSGNGKVCFLVNKLSGAACVGYELTWWTHLLARIKLACRGGFRPSPTADKKFGITFKNQNFFKHPWTEATVIYGYLYPPLMGRVEEKFLKDCKPGSIAVIRDFPFPNLIPAEVCRMPKKHEVYIYRKRG